MVLSGVGATPEPQKNTKLNTNEYKQENNPSIFDIGADDSQAGDGTISIGEQKKYLLAYISEGIKKFYEKCKFDFQYFIQNYNGFKEIKVNEERAFEKVQSAVQYANYQMEQSAKVNNVVSRTNEKVCSDYGANTKNEEQGIEFILNKLNNGNNVVIGDGNHSKTTQHDLVARNLDKLYDSGVRKIYLEFIRNADSWALDKFYETGDITDLARLKMDNIDNPESVLALIMLCKEKGIKCYAINNPNGSLISRNEGWANVVKRTNTNDDRYILIGGSAHLSKDLGEKGIDKMLGDNIAVLELNNQLKFSWENNNQEEPGYMNKTDNYAVITY